jgi:hypothetical protein
MNGCRTFKTLIDIKKTLRQLQQDKDIVRAKQGSG